MKYAVEMSSGAMTYIPSLIKILSGIQKLMGRGELTDTRTAWGSHKPTFFLFFKIKNVKYKHITL
jgi:hypothetical protein